MTDREKLAEIVKGASHRCLPSNTTDFHLERFVTDLLSNGVTFATDTNAGSKWVPVSERLPDKHDRYLCNVKAFSFPDLCYFAILKYDDGGFIEGKIYTDDVTHWMPLPEPPKER